ncbi:MAG: hypothetical protein DMD94_05510 [Candidatus Rokuibacteriota bacterium]|nr:MAG: hypothetical protein DMD94_05510 [Candidatus Rokubacteria bacterium]
MLALELPLELQTMVLFLKTMLLVVVPLPSTALIAWPVNRKPSMVMYRRLVTVTVLVIVTVSPV